MTATRLASVLLILAATMPAHAGDFTNAAANAVLEARPTASCSQARAKTILASADMGLVAVVPPTKSLHRFVVNWKSDVFAVTVDRRDCGLDVVNYARAIEPYCHYVNPLMSGCRLDMGLAN